MEAKAIKTVLYSFITSLVLLSCQNQSIHRSFDKDQETAKNRPIKSSVRVTEQQAIEVAEKFARKYNFQLENVFTGQLAKTKGETKKIGNILALADENQKEALYLINYSSGGFVVVPADVRKNPILAYSEQNKMPVSKNERIPRGLEFWLQNQVNAIEKVRVKKQKSETHVLWDRLLNGSNYHAFKMPPDTTTCNSWNDSVSPLIETQWGQQDRGGLNASMPQMNYCKTYNSDFPDNGRGFTGCVAIAMEWYAHQETTI